VEERYRGTGVASVLIHHANKRLKESGCRFAVAFTISPNGYERWGYVTYSDYELNGKRPSSILPDELSVKFQDFQKIHN
jgi:predicted acetyltransferase